MHGSSFRHFGWRRHPILAVLFFLLHDVILTRRGETSSGRCWFENTEAGKPASYGGKEKRMKRMILGVMMGALLTGTASFAQIRQRQENQQDRIGEGVENGSLTPKETSQLEHQETRLNKQIRHDRATGGGLSPQERRQINHQQNVLSRKIYRDKHDGKH
jgi:hypothetical protein